LLQRSHRTKRLADQQSQTQLLQFQLEVVMQQHCVLRLRTACPPQERRAQAFHKRCGPWPHEAQLSCPLASAECRSWKRPHRTAWAEEPTELGNAAASIADRNSSRTRQLERTISKYSARTILRTLTQSIRAKNSCACTASALLRRVAGFGSSSFVMRSRASGGMLEGRVRPCASMQANTSSGEASGAPQAACPVKSSYYTVKHQTEYSVN
jgi:hypothetical protein